MNPVSFLSLLFFLLNLPNHMIASDFSDNPCRANVTTILQFKFLDEFGDDSSVLFSNGGKVQLGCKYQSESEDYHSCDSWWAMFYKDGIKDEKLIWGYERDKYADNTLVELPTILGSHEESVFTAVLNGEYSIGCTCCEGREEKSVRLQLMGEICNPVNGKVCFPDGVCVQKVARNKQKQGCESRTLVNKTENAHFLRAYQAWYGNSIRGFHPAPEFDQFQRYLWPKMEVKVQLDDGMPRELQVSEVENIWEQDLYFRQLIPVKQTPFLLQLRRQEKYQKWCHNQPFQMVCKLKAKTYSDVQPKLEGNCSYGWSLSAEAIWAVESAKIYCKLSVKYHEDAVRWQFHVLPFVANVTIEKNGTKRCHWPIWTEKKPTELKGSECEKLQKTISYPPPQAGTVISFETMRSPDTEDETRSTSSVKTSEETISKVPKFVRIAPIVITVIAVVQLLPILLYTIYVKYKGWRNFQKIQRDERRRELAKIKRKKEEEDYKRWEEAQKKNYF